LAFFSQFKRTKMSFFCFNFQVVMTNTVEQAVRQAGVIYVKNMIGSHWQVRDVEANPAAIASGQV
jgi:hypothetical protein